MADVLPNIPWDRFRDIMRQSHDVFEKKVITWKKNPSGLSRYGEDTKNGSTPISLEVQLNYNFIRTWPITQETETGGLDRQSVQVMVNKQWLSEQGFLNSNGALDYDPERDRFVIDGLLYKSMGDTDASQAMDDPILFTMILKREDTPTGTTR